MTYIIAEVGGNHDGSVDSAIRHVKAAKVAGADAVKFQIYHAEKLVTPDVQAFKQAKGYKYQIDRFRDLELSEAHWEDVIGACQDEQIDFLATCFDLETLKKYEPYMSRLKIASGDLTYKDLVVEAGKYNKPVYLSTGMARFEEIQMASHWVPDHLLTVLHCVSCYPCPDIHVNINQITKLRQFYKRVGYSDHSLGISACLAAVSLGAQVIEKHFTLSPEKTHGDHPHSAGFSELKSLVDHSNRINKMFGYEDMPACETETQRFRRGGYAAHDISAGTLLQAADIMCLRPATQHYPHEYVGKTVQKDIKQGESLDG
jgi:N,N'-diacetyllegionaminate synthase